MAVLVVVLLVGLCGGQFISAAVQGGGCNPVSYEERDRYGLSVAYVMIDLQAVTPTRPSYDYNNTAPYADVPAYGHANCSTAVKAEDCGICLYDAAEYLTDNCVRSIGAHAVLDNCYMRYEPYSF